MERKLRKVLLGCGITLCLSFLVYPVLIMSKAQNGQNQEQNKPQNENNQNQEQRSSKFETGLQAIRQIDVANNLYNILQEKEPEWTLTKASYFPPRSESKSEGYSVKLDLKKGKEVVSVGIVDGITLERAKRIVHGPISIAIIKYCKGEECGDEGRMVYYDGKFRYMDVRKDNILVGVSCKSEKTAKRFALYVLNAIAGN